LGHTNPILAYTMYENKHAGVHAHENIIVENTLCVLIIAPVG